MKTRFLLFSVLVINTGCSIEASLLDMRAPDKFLKNLTKSSGLSSGSSQAGSTSSMDVSYQVQSAVGNYTSGLEQETSDNTYKVYSSVQGVIVSN